MPFEASDLVDRCCPRNLHTICAYALLAGDGETIQQFQSDRFINGMSLALCLFYLFPTVFGDDMVRFFYPNCFNSPCLVRLPIFAGVLCETSGEVAQAPWPAARDRELYQHLPKSSSSTFVIVLVYHCSQGQWQTVKI